MSLPVLSGEEAIKLLGLVGFVRSRQKGSHVTLRNDQGRVAVVPLHRELAPGTLRSILRQAGLTAEEFSALARRH